LKTEYNPISLLRLNLNIVLERSIKAIYTSQNPILFVLAIALASGAFKDYKTVSDIFNLKALCFNRLILKWADYMLNVPIFRGLTPRAKLVL
jgi:hypothetical protein